MYYENFKSLLKDLDNDFELMDEIIVDLETLVSETKLNIEEGLKKNDCVLIEKTIHKLKGALLNFRISDEVKLLETLEDECSKGNITSVYSKFEIIYKNLIQLSLDYKRYQKDVHSS